MRGKTLGYELELGLGLRESEVEDGNSRRITSCEIKEESKAASFRDSIFFFFFSFCFLGNRGMAVCVEAEVNLGDEIQSHTWPSLPLQICFRRFSFWNFLSSARDQILYLENIGHNFKINIFFPLKNIIM